MPQTHHHTPPTLWVLLADGEHARVVCPGTVAGSFHTAFALDSAKAHLRSRDLGTDQPGRSFESMGNSRSSVGERHDLHEQAKERFLAFVADAVNQAATEGRFDQLVVVAHGRALHALREQLGELAQQRVIGTLEKDLLPLPDHELGPHLTEWTPKTAG